MSRLILPKITMLAILACPVCAQDSVNQRDEVKSVVIAAFEKTHNGFSSDEVILQKELNDAFLNACRDQLPDSDAFELNWTLLNLRKAGALKIKATRRDPRKSPASSPIAEMCARMLEDKYGKSIDRLMADPETRNEFDQAALQIDPNIDPYLIRKAAFRLRKTRRLRPELITRIADWGREVSQHKVSEIRKHPDLVPDTAGIYLFRDKGGYLYIGEAIDLRARLQQHLDESHNPSLANYLKRQGFAAATVEIHSFDPDSRINELVVRRAYESELIRSRKPRFNIRP